MEEETVLYIFKVGKQDIAVAILFLFASLILLNNIFEKKSAN